MASKIAPINSPINSKIIKAFVLNNQLIKDIKIITPITDKSMINQSSIFLQYYALFIISKNSSYVTILVPFFSAFCILPVIEPKLAVTRY